MISQCHSTFPTFGEKTSPKTHLYEYYQRDPRRGWTASLDTSSRIRGWESSISANRLQASGEGLWNLGSITYDLDRYSECAPAFRRLAAVKPESAPAWTMAGLCEYCHGKITNGDFDWVLSRIEQDESYRG